MYSYLAAERCEKIAIELEQSAIKEDEKRVIENFLNLMVEAKALKVHIGKMTNKPADVKDFDRYGKWLALMSFFLFSFQTSSYKIFSMTNI